MDKEQRKFEHEIYSTRMLIFIEDEPQSNQYHQLILTEDEFKKTAMTIGRVVKTGEVETVELQESEELYTLPDLPEIYK